jgi:ectoine hydroxylase-related dioxygenase (phytanoyl-CoA dioxygenase family)
VPGGTNQAWHFDNQSRGLTIIVPLVDFTAENGSTQVLVGSHTKAWSLVVAQGARVVEAPVGAVAAYDSRTLHRGLGNATDDGRPAVIFCYDRTTSPPPGCGPYGSLANAYLAGALNIVSAGWIACASPGK